jgi:hypothetical protein
MKRLGEDDDYSWLQKPKKLVKPDDIRSWPQHNINKYVRDQLFSDIDANNTNMWSRSTFNRVVENPISYPQAEADGNVWYNSTGRAQYEQHMQRESKKAKIIGLLDEYRTATSNPDTRPYTVANIEKIINSELAQDPSLRPYFQKIMGVKTVERNVPNLQRNRDFAKKMGEIHARGPRMLELPSEEDVSKSFSFSDLSAFPDLSEISPINRRRLEMEGKRKSRSVSFAELEESSSLPSLYRQLGSFFDPGEQYEEESSPLETSREATMQSILSSILADRQKEETSQLSESMEMTRAHQTFLSDVLNDIMTDREAESYQQQALMAKNPAELAIIADEALLDTDQRIKNVLNPADLRGIDGRRIPEITYAHMQKAAEHMFASRLHQVDSSFEKGINEMLRASDFVVNPGLTNENVDSYIYGLDPDSMNAKEAQGFLALYTKLFPNPRDFKKNAAKHGNFIPILLRKASPSFNTGAPRNVTRGQKAKKE